MRLAAWPRRSARCSARRHFSTSSPRSAGFVVDELRDLVEGRYGTTPAEVDPTVARTVQLLGDGVEPAEEPPEALEELREDAKGLAASEEELLLLALYGEEAEPLLRSVRGRGRRDESETAGLAPSEAERLREIIKSSKNQASGR